MSVIVGQNQISVRYFSNVDGSREDTGLLPREIVQGMYLRLTFRSAKAAVQNIGCYKIHGHLNCVVQRAFERQYRAAVKIQRWLLRVRSNPRTTKAASVVQALWRGRVGTKFVNPTQVTG